MSKTVKITCDGCGLDLSKRSQEEIRIVLTCDTKKGLGAAVTPAEINGARQHTFHFCALECLDHWRRRDRHLKQLWAVWHAKQRDDDECEVDPQPGLRAELAAAFEADALAAYPLTPKWNQEAEAA